MSQIDLQLHWSIVKHLLWNQEKLVLYSPSKDREKSLLDNLLAKKKHWGLFVQGLWLIGKN